MASLYGDARALRASTAAGPTGPSLSRRTLLQVGGASATAVALTARPSLAAAPASDPDRERRDALSVLVDRTTFGFTEATMSEARSLGFDGWLDQQLDPGSIDDSECDARLGQFLSLNETAATLEDDSWPLAGWEIAHELQAARLIRAVYSKRQLLERMVEFWTDHFNIAQGADEQGILKTVDDREVIRAHALGNFKELLLASAKSAAMLAYLDNSSNVVDAPNENYSREVMELHTLGVDGPYTEDDVRELARCFTGWTYWRAWESEGDYGVFRFRDDRHDFGAKTVLGIDIPAGGGVSDGEMMLEHLALHPKTADYLARKLGRWLIGYEPNEILVQRAKAAFFQSGGEIEPMLRAFLKHEALGRFEPGAIRKFKRPLHWFASMIRALGGDLDDPKSTIWEISSLGQDPFRWPAPDGYPDSIEAWGLGLIQRWRSAARTSHSWSWSYDLPAELFNDLLAGVPKDAWGQRINFILRGGQMTPRDVQIVQGYVDSFSNETDTLRQEAFQLALASPSFQYY